MILSTNVASLSPNPSYVESSVIPLLLGLLWMGTFSVYVQRSPCVSSAGGWRRVAKSRGGGQHFGKLMETVEERKCGGLSQTKCSVSEDEDEAQKGLR